MKKYFTTPLISFHILASLALLAMVGIVWLIVGQRPNFELISGIEYLTFFCLGIYSWILFSAYQVRGAINIYLILVFLSIPFYLGDQISILLGLESNMLLSDHSILDRIIPDADIFQAMFLLMSCLISLHVGYLLTVCPKSEKSFPVVTSSFSSKKGVSSQAMLCISALIFLITLIPTIVARGYEMFVAITVGHLSFRLDADQYMTGIFYYFDYLADWFVPACLMMLISCRTSFYKRLATYSILGYCALYILAGNRFEVLGVLIALGCVYVYWFKYRLPLSKICKYGLLIFAIIIIFEMVGLARNNSSGVNMFSWNVLKGVLDKGFLYSIFETTGNTFTSIANTIRCVPSLEPFNYGKSIVGSLIYILPSSFRDVLMGNMVLHISATLSPYYYGWTLSGYGSSYITEAYFNFGYYAIGVVVLYGVILGKVINSLTHPVYHLPYRFFFYSYLILEFSMAIRNDLYQIPRHLVLYVLIPYILCRLISKQTTNSPYDK